MAVPSESMYPTLKTGNLLVGVRRPREINRGDVLAFQSSDGVIMIKRLIGLPGEQIYIDESGSVFIDGESLAEQYVVNWRSGKPQEFLVPEGCVLFLGDNRTGSYDARYWDDPYIPIESILAKAGYIIFPSIEEVQ